MLQLDFQIDQIVASVLLLVLILSFVLLFRQVHYCGPNKTTVNKSVIIIVALLAGGVFVLGTFITGILVKNETKKINEELYLSNYALKEAVEGKINKIDAGLLGFTRSADIRSIFLNRSIDKLKKHNDDFVNYCKAFDANTVIFIDTNGENLSTCIVNDSAKYSGIKDSSRYFRQAITDGKSRYFSIGANSTEQGYFSSVAINDDYGKVIGVVVMICEIRQIEEILSRFPNAFLVSKDGAAFNTQHKKVQLEYDYSYLLPFSKETMSDSADKHKIFKMFDVDSRMELNVPGWSILMISSKASVYKYRIMGFAITFILVLCVIFMIHLIILARVKQWAESVFLSEKLFQTVFQNAPEPIIICERSTGLILFANKMAFQKTGLCLEGLCISELIESKSENKSEIPLPLTCDSMGGSFVSKAGKEIQEFSMSSVQIWFRGKDCLVSFVWDVTEVKKIQKALEESEKRFRELTDFLPEGVFELDTNLMIRYANTRAFEMFGYEYEDISKGYSAFDMIRKEERAHAQNNLSKVFSGNQSVNYEYTALHKNGKMFPVMIHSTPIIRNGKITGLCGICVDLTERVKFEEEMLKKDKLEALGIMAGGIAHDFNNLLTAIWAGLSIIKLRNENKEQNKILNDMENALRRGKDLTGQLLTYSKGGAPIKEATSLELLVKDTADFAMAGSHVKCEISSEDNIYPVEVDVTQISQVVQNLLINAVEAMPKGGKISINMKNTENPKVENIKSLSGKYVELAISDTGTGIPNDIRSRIFDPFFTTKKNGSGLGLATSYSIVKKHNGHLYFDSLANGTTFRILLPATKKNVISKKDVCQIPCNCTGRILLMDDEMMILTVTKELLTHFGYQVEIAQNGEDAVECFKKALNENTPYDALILDLTVPAGMGGKETIVKIREIDPVVKAIVSSGYSNDPIMAEYEKYGFNGFILKPFDVKELYNALQSVLSNQL